MTLTNTYLIATAGANALLWASLASQHAGAVLMFLMNLAAACLLAGRVKEGERG